MSDHSLNRHLTQTQSEALKTARPVQAKLLLGELPPPILTRLSIQTSHAPQHEDRNEISVSSRAFPLALRDDRVHITENAGNAQRPKK